MPSHSARKTPLALKFPGCPTDAMARDEMPTLPTNAHLFETLSDGERLALAHFMRERHFDAGETVCSRGQHGNTMLVVVQGTLSAVVSGKDNPQAEVARLEAGSVLGETFCIDPAPRPVTVVASESTTVLEISRDDLTRMRQEAPRVAAALVSAVFQEVLRRLRCLDDRVDRELRAEGVGGAYGDADNSVSDRAAATGCEARPARPRGSA